MTKRERALRHWRTKARRYGAYVRDNIANPDYPVSLLVGDSREAFHYARLARQEGYFGEGRGPQDGPTAGEAGEEE